MMRKTLILSTLLFLLISNAYSQAYTYGWQSLNFIAQENLFSVKCINDDIAICVGENGYIIRTIDGGEQWSQIQSNTANTLNKIDFINDTLGFILGNNGTILKTTDAGNSWDNIGIESQFHFREFSAINENAFWVAGDNTNNNIWPGGDKGILLKTINCGATWSIDSSFNNGIHSVSFVNIDTGYICANGLQKTTNSGISFETIDPQINTEEHNGTLNNVKFVNDSIGFISMNSTGGIFKTSDSGNTWLTVSDQWGVFDFKIIDACSVYCLWYDMPGEASGWASCCEENIVPILESYYFNDVSFKNNIGFGAGGHTGYTPIRDKRICKWGILAENSSDNLNLDFEVHPNPTNGNIKILLPSQLENFEIELLDLNGRILQKKQNIDHLNLNNYSPGTYLIKVNGEGFTKQKKIIIY